MKAAPTTTTTAKEVQGVPHRYSKAVGGL